jgi:hypothetical protein
MYFKLRMVAASNCLVSTRLSLASMSSVYDFRMATSSQPVSEMGINRHNQTQDSNLFDSEFSISDSGGSSQHRELSDASRGAKRQKIDFTSFHTPLSTKPSRLDNKGHDFGGNAGSKSDHGPPARHETQTPDGLQ